VFIGERFPDRRAALNGLTYWNSGPFSSASTIGDSEKCLSAAEITP
jgi:hypothetical protein